MALTPLGPTTPCAGCGMLLLSSVNPVCCVTCYRKAQGEKEADTPVIVVISPAHDAGAD